MDEYKELRNKDEPNILNIDSFSQNISNIREIDADNFEDNLNISEIKDEMQKTKKDQNSINKNKICINGFSNQSIDHDFSEDLDSIHEDEFNQRKLSICSLHSEEFNSDNIDINLNIDNINNKRTNFICKKETKKITKEELNNIPIPVFSCIYCSNDIIANKHLLQEIITNKYLLQTSIYDIKDINKLLIYQPIIDKDDKNEKLLNIIIKNTEYINSNYTNEYIINFFKSNIYLNICNKENMNNKKNLMLKIEESIIKKKKDFYFKGINKIPKNSLNNRCLFNSTNSLINNYNALSGFVENIQTNNNNINICKNNNNTNNNSNISINFNSISLNNNEIGNCVCKDNNNLLVSIVEHIENNNECINELEDKEEIMDFFEFDNEKKLSKENIIWESNYYDIWNPNISDIEDVNDGIDYNSKENIDEINEKKYKLKVNLLKSKTSNNSFNYKKQKLSVSQMKSMGSTNSSSVINCDNDNYKIKSNILSHSKEKHINCSSNTIHVNTKQIVNENMKKKKNNNSMVINRSTSSSKSKNFINGLICNQNKVYPSSNNSTIFNINKSKNKLNNNLINKVSSSSFNINNFNNNFNNNSNTNSKYKKNRSKKFDVFEKNKIKEHMTHNKNAYRKINNFNSIAKSYYHNNYNYMNKTIGGSNNRMMSNISTSTSVNGHTKIISSKILFKRNNNPKINFINNNCQKPPQSSYNSQKMKLSYCSINKTNEKTPIDKIRKKISEITKIINSNKNYKLYNYHTNNKINSSLYKMSANVKNSKMKNKYDLSSNYYSNNNNNSNNNKLRMSHELKININNKNKKLFLSTSFLIKSRTKIIEKNSFKKYK